MIDKEQQRRRDRVERLARFSWALLAGRWEARAVVTGLYGVKPTIDFVEIAQLVDYSSASHQN